MDHRETTREEDKVYALLGIFDIQMSLIYGEGRALAFRRLRKEIDNFALDHQMQSCLKDLQTTDPRLDKKRIEETKGGLLADAYRWVLDNEDFKHWRCDGNDQLLWVKGDPGKGKTMLLCGIINELSASTRLADPKASTLLSYFFCQATDTRINNASAVLRGLIYMLVGQQPTLISHVRKRYDETGKQLFEDANAWTALTEIFSNILDDSNLPNTYLIIDALDECGNAHMSQVDGQSMQTGQSAELSRLLDFIAEKSTLQRVKWIVSSRNWHSIGEHLNVDGATQKARLSLEMNEKFVSGAVSIYTQHKLDALVSKKNYDKKTREAVHQHLLSNANDTFLWVALVCQELAKVTARKALKKLTEFPPGLDALYKRMMDQIRNLEDDEDVELCQQILAVASIVYRPITLDELASLVEMPDACGNDDAMIEVIGLCGSYLTLRERTIFFVHQSAKEFLLRSASNIVFPSGIEDIHHTVFLRSLQAISILRRDIYNLKSPGTPIEQVKQPSPDPLTPARYSCTYWVDHLHDCGIRDADDDAIDKFIRQKYLYWLEALSLLRSLSHGVLSMIKLEDLLAAFSHTKQGYNQVRHISKHCIYADLPMIRQYTSQLVDLIKDARRFIQYHKAIIESNPLQAYTSALLFSPTQSLIRRQFQTEVPQWITTKPFIDEEWGSCLTTLGGHGENIRGIAWFDDTLLASVSDDGTVKIWNSTTGQCQATFEIHNTSVTSIAWSTDRTRLASGSDNGTVKIWDPTTGQCQAISKGHGGHGNYVRSISWSTDGTRLAFHSSDHTIKIWDPTTGQYQCQIILQNNDNLTNSNDGLTGVWYKVAWSTNDFRVASGSGDGIIKIWDLTTGHCQAMFETPESIYSMAWSPDGTQLASNFEDTTIRTWDIRTGQCQATLEVGFGVTSLSWSADSTQLAVGNSEGTIKIWDLTTGQCKVTLRGHTFLITSLAWSTNGTRLASCSDDCTIRIWDPAISQNQATLKNNDGYFRAACSTDGIRLSSSSEDDHNPTIKIWNPVTGRCQLTLEGHEKWIMESKWSNDGFQFASISSDGVIKIWDPITGQCQVTLEDCTGNCPLAWSNNGTWLASGSIDGTVKIWDPTTGQCQATLGDHRDTLCGTIIEWSTDDTWLACGSEENITIWDHITGQCQARLDYKYTRVLSWSNDGTKLAFTSVTSPGFPLEDQCTIQICDVTTRQCQTIIGGLRSRIHSIAWSNDGTRLAISSAHDPIKIWDSTTGQCQATSKLWLRGLLRFDISDQYLHTDIGMFDLGSLEHSTSYPRIIGYGFTEGKDWITYEGEKLIWLPHEYRPEESKICREMMVITCMSGRVFTLGFSQYSSGLAL